MKPKIFLIGAIGAAAMGAGCGGGNNGSASTTPPNTTPPPTSSAMVLDTAQVLALAQVTSETASPFVVNNGAFVIEDTSDTTAPIAVAQ